MKLEQHALMQCQLDLMLQLALKHAVAVDCASLLHIPALPCLKYSNQT